MLELIEKGDFSTMDGHHHFLSGFKSLYTEWAYNGMEECRVACGGAGYSSWSGITEQMDFYSPQPTFEGDNTVMMQ